MTPVSVFIRVSLFLAQLPLSAYFRNPTGVILFGAMHTNMHTNEHT